MNLILLIVLLVHALSAAASKWYQSDVLYQIYPRSFMDTNGDGNGDIKGIIQKVPYLKSIGIDAVWLSPIYDSPWEDMGYDITNFTDVHPTFGTIADVKELIRNLHDNGMKFLMDFVPNHSSDKHVWFKDALLNKNGKTNYYVWEQPKGWTNDGKPIPPNNWQSIFGGSAWEFSQQKQMYYLHQFGTYQPDLNFENPEVVEEMKNVMRFWFDLGVDGFRVDAVPHLVEDRKRRDEPPVKGCTPTKKDPCLQHIFMQNRPETYRVLRDFGNMMLEEYGESKYLFLEAYAPPYETMKYYGRLEAPFNFVFILKNLSNTTDAITLKGMIDEYLREIPWGQWPNWLVGNHETHRIATRLGSKDLIDPINMMVQLLPGVAITYQGEEIGMVDGNIPPDRVMDPDGGRDFSRTPMQWDASKNAGFSTANRTWLPVNDDFVTVNVETQTNKPKSHLSIYKQLTALRKNLSSSKSIETTTYEKWIFGFKRRAGNKHYYVILNLGSKSKQLSLGDVFWFMKSDVQVAVSSPNMEYKAGNKIRRNQKLTLRSHSGLVVESIYNRNK